MWTRVITCAIICSAALAQDVPRLEILPSQPQIRRDLDTDGVFTCRAAEGFEGLVENVVWVDPQGMEVPEERQSAGPTTPRIFSSQSSTDQDRELYITKIMEQDSGTYTCKARYATNQEISKSFELVVYMSIRWEDAPTEQNPITGTQAKIKCVVRAKPVAVVEWFKDGSALRSGGRYVVEQDGLAIQNISSEDDGTYVCRAKVQDEGELRERHIHVEVYSRPEIVRPKPGLEVEVTEKEEGSIPCQTTGKPVPTRTWVNPDNADVSTLDGLSVNPRDGTLNFSPASRDMGGAYRCIAENAVGRVETTVNVVVIVKPEIIRYENVTVNEGDTATLECRVGGSPLPEVQFRKLSNQDRFENGESPQDDRISVTQREADGFRIGTLTISHLRRSDDGLYECIATNKGGSVLKNGHITTQFSPNFDNSPMRETYSWNKHAVNLTCVAESIPNATITWEFKLRLLEKDIDSKINQIGNGPTSILRVTPSDSTYYGTFTCKASNLLGQNTLDIELFEATVPSTLTDVQFSEVTATTIKFAMNGPANDGGLPLIAYAVQYKVSGQSWDARQERVWPVGTTYVLDDLRPEHVFVFRFAAKNDVGLGEWSAEQQMVMPRIDVPERPVILLTDLATGQKATADSVVTSELADSYTIQWQAGANNGEKIDNFKISYYEVARTKNGWRSVSDKKSSVVDFPGTHTFRLTGLKPETHYRVELRAHNKLGFGEPAEVIVLTAPDTAPEDEEEASFTVTEGGRQSRMASGALVGVVIGVLLVLLLLVDLTCYATNSRGFVHALCSRAHRRSGATKLHDDASEKEPLQEAKNGNGSAPAASSERDIPAVVIQDAPPEDVKDSSV